MPCSEYTSDLTSGQTFSSSKSDYQPISQLFDNLTTTAWGATSPSATEWVQVQFDSAKKIIRARFNCVNTFYWPSRLKIYGSNTGSFSGEETELYDSGSISSWSEGEWKTHDFENENSYTYYRIVFSRNASYTSFLIVAEVEMMECSPIVYSDSASDGGKFGDSASADFKNRGEIGDAAGIGDAVEGYDFKGELADAAGIGDAAAAEAEIYNAAADAAALSDTVDAFSLSDSFNFAIEFGDAVDAGFERVGELADAAGIGDAADAFNWTTWLRDNLNQAVARFYLTLTGTEDGTTDIEIPISSFQAKKRTGYDTYISAVIIGADYAEEIADRSNGQMIVEMAYLVGGVESIREEILRADLEKIMIQKSPNNRSITLYGRRSETFVGKAAALTKPIYSSQYEGRMTYRFAVPDPYLNPGDTLTVEDDEATDELTVDQVTYYVSATGGTTSMEVTE